MVNLKDVFFKAFACEDIKESFSSADIAGWDSFSHLKLVMLLEEECKISLTTDEVVGIKCVQDVMSLLEKKNINYSF
jgi:acyl carrier protein